MKILQDLTYEELQNLMNEQNQQSFRAKQIYENINHGKTISEITNLPKNLKQNLLKDYCDEPIKIFKSITSKETTKFIYELCDGAHIEGVLMQYKYGNTICVSTQVGCRMGCLFCASGLHGLIRNLSAGEILSQVLTVNKYLGGTMDNRKITNIVLMGSGEPFDNYDNVIKFLRLVTDEKGLNVSVRNISLSTCGLCEKIDKFCEENLPITLTISLHAPNDVLRQKSMPIARKYKISEILKSAKKYFDKTGRRVIFEYALIKDQNDSFACAEELAKIKNYKFAFHINLIPLNFVKERNMHGSTRKEAYAFAKRLTELGVSATVRRTLGEDIGGACGQLVNSNF